MSKILTITFVLFFCFILQANAQEWLVYDASVLPDQNDPAFNISTNDYGEFGADSTSWIVNDTIMPGNKLLKFITVDPAKRFLWRISNLGVNPAKGATFMFRVKALDMDVYDRIFELDIRSGGVREKVVLRDESRIQLERAEEDNRDIERMGNWHTYRVTYFDSVTNVYMDEDPTPVVTGKTPDAVTDDYFRFGDGSTSTNYGGFVDWIIWDTTGTYAPGAGAAIPAGLYVDQADEQVAYWKLDETTGSVVADELGNSNGTLVNGGDSLWVAGWDGNAIDFAKAVDSAYIEIPDNEFIEFDSTQSFTISMLVKTDPVNYTSEMNVVYKGANNTSQPGWEGKWYAVQFKNGLARFFVDDNSVLTNVSPDITETWPINRWAHLVAIRDRDQDSLFMYLNGEKIGSKVDNTELDISSGDLPLVIGTNQAHSTPFKGQLDDVQMFNYALSADDVEVLFDSYGLVKDVKLAHWKFDETSGTTVTDEMGNCNGTVVNGGDSLWVAGWDGNAIDFGIAVDSAYVEIPDNNILEFDSTESFTISMLVKADPVGNETEQEIIMKGSFGADEQMGWEGTRYQMQLKDGQARIAVDDDVNKTQLGPEVGDIWPSRQWVHLVGVRDRTADVLRLYMNGELIGETEDKTELDITSGDVALRMGLNVTGEKPLDGQLDDVQIFNYALNPAAIEAMYDAYGLPPVLAAHWEFDEVSGTTANDEVGPSDGTLTNMTGTEWTTGHVGGAIDFTSAPDTAYIEVPANDNVEFDSTQSFSISLLVNADPITNTAEMNIVYKGANNTSQPGWEGKWYAVQFKDQKARFFVDDNVTNTNVSPVVTNIYPANQWAHLVAVRDHDQDSLFLYLNGDLIGSKYDATDLDISSSNLPLVIGNNQAHATPFKGMIDDLQIYNYAFSPAKVKLMSDSYGMVSSVPREEFVPVAYELSQNYPNPFNPSTTIEFTLAKAGKTQLTIFNTLGQKVATLVDQDLSVGTHRVTFNASILATGLYFYRLESGDFTLVKKMILIK